MDEAYSRLTSQSRIRRIPEIALRILPSEGIQILFHGTLLEFGSHALAVLDAFARPVSLVNALQDLRSRVAGPLDWMDLSTTLVQLYEAGVLVDDASVQPRFRAAGSGYDSAPIHVAMLNDRERTSKFISGIHEVVRQGDIVLDLGTGTGVLALAAVKAGARHVYAIESSGIANLAEAVFAANGVADRVTVLDGWSTRIALPEPADVLVGDIIGSEPLSGQVLEAYADAGRRLLKPNARMIPRKLTIFALPVGILRTELMNHAITAEAVANWRAWYNMDFSALQHAVKGSPHAFLADPLVARAWKPLSDPAVVAEVDFREIGDFLIDNEATVVANRSGSVDGILEYFELELGPGTTYSTHPAQMDANSCRRTPVWALAEPIVVNRGDRMIVTYQYRVTEEKVRMNCEHSPNR